MGEVLLFAEVVYCRVRAKVDVAGLVVPPPNVLVDEEADARPTYPDRPQ